MWRTVQPAIYEATCDKCRKIVNQDRYLKVRFTCGHESREYDLCADCFGTLAALIPDNAPCSRGF